MIKQCTDCGEFKEDLGNFYFWKTANRYLTRCIPCHSKFAKQQRYKTKLKKLGLIPKNVTELDKINDSKKCSQCFLIKDLDCFYFVKTTNRFHLICKECESLNFKQAYIDDKTKFKTRAKEQYLKHREKILISSRKRSREWLSKPGNKEKQQASACNRLKRNPLLRLNKNVSSYLRRYLRKNKNGKSWTKWVGYNTLELKEHLEKLFKPQMSWDNYGKEWHIDHIIPVKYFAEQNLSPEEFAIKCWALSNLQPLWKHENFSKGCKMI